MYKKEKGKKEVLEAKKLYIEKKEDLYMGGGVHFDLEESFAVFEICVSECKEKVEKFCLLEGDWYTLSGTKTNLLKSPFSFIRFFRRVLKETLKEFPYLIKAYSYLERFGFTWVEEDGIYTLDLK